MIETESVARATRREFVAGAIAAGASTLGACSSSHGQVVSGATEQAEKHQSLAGQLGIVTASAGRQLSGRASGRNFTLLELPRIMRDELGLTVLDLNTSSIPSFASVSNAYLDKLRSAVENAGCVLSNLKMNQRGIDMNSTQADVRKRALAEYRRSIDIASRLGCRWARPLPQSARPDMAIHVASYQSLCEYGQSRNVKMLVENFGWMQSDPDSVPRLLKAIGANVAAGPDTGNWNSNSIRYAGLAKVFPHAVTCDFKARTMGPDGSHPLYDLRRCFEIGWRAGFRGPWCFEHANADTNKLFQELRMLREMILWWTASVSGREKD